MPDVPLAVPESRSLLGRDLHGKSLLQSPVSPVSFCLPNWVEVSSCRPKNEARWNNLAIFKGQCPERNTPKGWMAFIPLLMSLDHLAFESWATWAHFWALWPSSMSPAILHKFHLRSPLCQDWDRPHLTLHLSFWLWSKVLLLCHRFTFIFSF